MAEGVKAADIPYINKYASEHFDGAFECKWTAQKGRVLHATRSVKSGEVLLKEKPLHVVQEEPTNPMFQCLSNLCKEYANSFEYPILGYWCALRSLTEEQLQGATIDGGIAISPDIQRKLLILHHPAIIEPSEAAEFLVEEIVPSADPILLDALMSVWVLNCFEYSENPRGSSTYFLSSFLSHSCFPNAVWHNVGGQHVLRARSEIHIGDEITISYFDDAVLLLPAPVRRARLNLAKHFWCSCVRCSGAEDLSRGFVCPSCNTGKIFARTPEAGPAVEGDALLISHLLGMSCRECRHTLSKREAANLVRQEDKLRDILKGLIACIEDAPGTDFPQLEDICKLECFIDGTFAQHILAVQTWEQIAEIYCILDSKSDQHRLLKERCNFCSSAYDGPNSSYAWALEAYGDALAEAANDSPSKVARSRNQTASRTKYLGLAQKAYEEARDILILLFGAEHDYVQELEIKYFDVFES